MCDKRSGIWRVHVPDLGQGQCLSRLRVLYNYCASPSHLISSSILRMQNCACRLVSAQEALKEGRWVCALILIAQHPVSLPPPGPFTPPDFCFTSGLSSRMLASWVSDTTAEIKPHHASRSSPWGTVLASSKLNSHIWHVTSVIFPLPVSVFAFLYFLWTHFYSNIVINIFKNIYHLTEKIFCRSQKFIFFPKIIWLSKVHIFVSF